MCPAEVGVYLDGFLASLYRLVVLVRKVIRHCLAYNNDEREGIKLERASHFLQALLQASHLYQIRTIVLMTSNRVRVELNRPLELPLSSQWIPSMPECPICQYAVSFG